ncbi:MAG TPA: glycosyltransferase family 4 protein [Candidatus Corynebacterium avicola]|uniref:Glycosyltransferase family 4 protein n=1 Tax=Candidatus Corynebacterium avicola TaxID=2838527 RepID=A0A9D1RMZ7_9CORY|nr:glycosyltransferase family 4 protein [Candidatus Corynebacterium avicola]
MKVLLLCWRDSGHPEGGGSEVYLERVAEHLARRGHQVTYRTARYRGSARREQRNGVNYVRGGGNLTVYPRAWWHMLRSRVLTSRAGERPDVIVDTQNGVPFFAAVFGGWCGGVPTVLLTHHCHREQWPVAGPVLSRVGWFLESRVSPWLHRRLPYVTVSEPSADELVDLGVDRARVRVIRNGVDVPEDLADLSGANLDTPETAGRTHLVTLSRLVPHKQIEHAMDALATVLPTHPDTYLDVIGDGWWSDNLRRHADELGISGNVIFHGHVSEQVKHLLLARADLHVLPSRKEGWGLAVIEAGLHGVPTLGYHTSAGLRDSVIDGSTGLLVGSEGGLINSLAQLLDDPDRLAELGENARRRARTFSWGRTGAQWEQLLADVVGNVRR